MPVGSEADAAGEGHEGVAVGDEVFLALGEGTDADELADGLRVDDVVAEEGGERRPAEDCYVHCAIIFLVLLFLQCQCKATHLYI